MGLTPFTGKSPGPNPCMLLMANIAFLVRALEISVFSQSRIRDKDIQCTVLNVKPSGCQLVTTFLSNSPKSLVMETATNGFPSVTSVLQHLVCKDVFPRCTVYLLPAFCLGLMRKSFLFFKEALLIIVQACA